MSEMRGRLEDRCAVCPELLADGYGKCDHRRCMACVREERFRMLELSVAEDRAGIVRYLPLY